MNAKSSLCTISEDEIKWAQQNSIFKAQRDYNEGMYCAEERGFARGVTTGAQQASIANAKNFLLLNKLAAEEIARCCSLPLEQVLALKEELAHENVAATM